MVQIINKYISLKKNKIEKLEDFSIFQIIKNEFYLDCFKLFNRSPQDVERTFVSFISLRSITIPF